MSDLTLNKITAHETYVRSQSFRPSPLKPRLHTQSYDVGVLRHVALAWQSCSSRWHSSTSGHTPYDQSAGSLIDTLWIPATRAEQLLADSAPEVENIIRLSTKNRIGLNRQDCQ